MKQVIKYKLIKYSSRKFWVLRYEHPTLGNKEQSTKLTSRSKAERWAAEFIQGVAEDLSLAGRMTWRAFRRRYEKEHILTSTHKSAFNAFEARWEGKYLDEITASEMAKFKTKLLKDGLSEATAANYAKHVMISLRWAHAVGLILAAPRFSPGSTRRMRGRPITQEEFERMLRACGKVVGKEHAKTWQRVLRAIRSVGLRRSEILTLSWDDPTRIHLVGIDSRIPKIVFPAEAHKAGRDMTLPLTPDAVELFRTWATKDRHGPVFPRLYWQERRIINPDGLGRAIAAIGRKALVVTHRDHRDERQFACAHDLRRSFGTRLAENPKLSIAQVAQLMRHQRIETTMEHYVQSNADRLGADVYSAFGCIPGCTKDATKRRLEESEVQVVKELS